MRYVATHSTEPSGAISPPQAMGLSRGTSDARTVTSYSVWVPELPIVMVYSTSSLGWTPTAGSTRLWKVATCDTDRNGPGDKFSRFVISTSDAVTLVRASPAAAVATTIFSTLSKSTSACDIPYVPEQPPGGDAAWGSINGKVQISPPSRSSLTLTSYNVWVPVLRTTMA